MILVHFKIGIIIICILDAIRSRLGSENGSRQGGGGADEVEKEEEVEREDAKPSDRHHRSRHEGDSNEATPLLRTASSGKVK